MSARRSNLKSTQDDGQSRAGLLHAIRFFALIAMVASAYLAWVSLSGSSAVGCGPDSACDKVLQSRWSYWFKIPVSVFALMTYSLILGASFRLSPKNDAKVRRNAWACMVAGALMVLGAGAWFTGLMYFAIKAFCPYCLVSHGCGAVASILTLFCAPLRHPSAKPWELEKLVFVAPRTFRKVAVVAILALAALISGQGLYQRPTMVVQRMDLPTNAISSQAPTSAVVQSTASTNVTLPPAPPPAPPIAPATQTQVALQRMFPVYAGRFQVDILDAPVIGSPTNEHVVVSLFDYTCHHCRSMHAILLETQQMFSNSLVMVSLPMPLDPDCNPTMQRHHPSHTNACDYARLGLAVWRADRTKHHEFDDWLMTGDKPPPLADARQKAAQLVSPAALEKARMDPWVEQHLRLSVGMYELAYRAQRGSMPQLIVGPNVALGIYAKPELVKMLTESLGLKPAE